MIHVGHIFRSENPEFRINPEKSHPLSCLSRWCEQMLWDVVFTTYTLYNSSCHPGQ